MSCAAHDGYDPGVPWPAPAKLNLFLHITGRRADGYHLLQTIFQFIDFKDQLYFALRDDAAIRRLTDVPGVPAERDLVVRAARALQQAAGVARGVDIRLDKRLPMGGGLGGGSSDAATTLVALNHLWRIDWPVDRLAAIGLTLGADVPVFVRGRAAWAEGVGEALEPVVIPEPWYLILVPAVHVNTGAVFAAPELTRDMHPITIRDFLAGKTRNVFEPVVKSRYPEVAAALEWLARKGAAPRLTGTGACVFAAFDTAAQAQAVAACLPPNWHGVVARGLNTSPLYGVTF